MRVVFDTNIFISALIFPGSQAEKAILRIIGNDNLILSPAILKEVLAVLSKKFSRDREELSKVAVHLAYLALMVTPETRIEIFQDEPDNRILECAVAGGADLIVTGDKAMLELLEFEGIRIVSLRDYLQSF
jgi:putative PIN family toxin of toxin-antitoxin system